MNNHMEMNIFIVLSILLIHFIGDFIVQSDKQAKGKSSSWKYLLEHTLGYSVIFIIIGSIYGIFINDAWLGLKFGLITFICHTVSDYFTSRINKSLWERGEVHNFFVGVGADQFLHYLQLLLTFRLLS